MNKHLNRAVWLTVCLLVGLAMTGCNHPETPEGSLVPRHDRPFDVLPPEHIKALEESRKAGR